MSSVAGTSDRRRSSPITHEHGHKNTKPAPGEISVIAGVGQRAGIPAREADAGWPMGVARRPDGDLIVIDYQWHRIWRIDRDGTLHAFAGDGIAGDSGDGGPAAKARFRHPMIYTRTAMAISICRIWATTRYVKSITRTASSHELPVTGG